MGQVALARLGFPDFHGAGIMLLLCKAASDGFWRVAHRTPRIAGVCRVRGVAASWCRAEPGARLGRSREPGARRARIVKGSDTGNISRSENPCQGKFSRIKGIICTGILPPITREQQMREDARGEGWVRPDARRKAGSVFMHHARRRASRADGRKYLGNIAGAGGSRSTSTRQDDFKLAPLPHCEERL